MKNSKGQPSEAALVNRSNGVGSALLILLAIVACMFQFKVSSLIPLAVATGLFGLASLASPLTRKISAGLFLGSLLLLWMDVSVLHHRIAVWCRVSLRILDHSVIEQVLPSPSGQTVVYLVGEHWLDSRYKVFVSDGGLFPKMASVPAAKNSESERHKTTALWTGNIFQAVADGGALRYSEENRVFEPNAAATE